MRIGLFGGSFNPIHNGHIALGTTMLSAMSLDEIWYLVSPLNPWKIGARDIVDENIRLKLTELALQDFPKLKASDYEFHLEKPNYSWKTLKHLTKDFPQHEFILILGGDNMERFYRWANYKFILKNFSLAVFPREGSDLEAIIERYREDAKSIHVVNVPKINISSSMLRDMIKQDKDISSFIPKDIAGIVSKYYKL